LYKFKNLYFGIFIKRYKRFFVDIKYNDQIIVAHNPNTGSMRSILDYGNEVVFSKSDNVKRKLPFTLEGIKVENRWMVTNTILINKIVENAIIDGEVEEFRDFDTIKREYKYKDCRFDFLIIKKGDRHLIEVKNVTMFDESYAYFPDAVTGRGLKHLNTLFLSKDDGYIPYMLYIVQPDRTRFRCADFIDFAYCKKLKELEGEIKILKYKSIFDPEKKECRLALF